MRTTSQLIPDQLLSSYLNQEVSGSEPRPPGHAPLVHRLQVLQGRKGRRWDELLDRGFGWKQDGRTQLWTGEGEGEGSSPSVLPPLAPLRTKPKPSLSLFCRTAVFSSIT